MIIEEKDYFAHYGTPRHSGRYPWGSGGNADGSDNPAEGKTISMRAKEMMSQGLSEKQVATALGYESIKDLRAAKSIERNAQRQADISRVQKLKDKGYSPAAISRRTGLPDSTVRSYLEPGAKDKADILEATSNMIKQEVDKKGMVDVGRGVENYIGVSKTRLDTAVSMAKQDGYAVHSVKIPQIGTGHDTTTKVVCTPGMTWSEAQKNRFTIQQITNFSDDGGRTYGRVHEPLSIDPKRLDVKYRGEGGEQADGMIYLRRNIDDVSLGGTPYAQVRVKIGPDHYIKGMATYKDDLPDGVDIQFNTSKPRTANKLDALKRIDDNDPELPFGAIVRQILDKPGTSEERVTSAINIVSGSAAAEKGNEEGTWATWSRNLSSQMLSKQSPQLARTQLDMTYERRQQQLDELRSLTNPTVKKKLLEEFADGTDAAAVHLQAAALPGQATHVILPISKIKPTEIFAPGYENGEEVALIRYPHGGTFEIPVLVVNNKNAEGRKLLGPKAQDAVGIHHSVAQQLSGADFDGDTVVVIPNSRRHVLSTPALEGLKNFDPISAYPGYPGMKVMKNTQTEMGKISNLITDMTIKNAPPDEIVRAVKHSMVVIDAEKKELNHRLSRTELGIKDLEEKYQRQPDGTAGAATLISRARSEYRVPERKPRPQSKGGPVDPATGRKVFEPTNKKWRSGKPRMDVSTRLAEADDAFSLSSGTPMEALYARHSNKLKELANQARLDALNTPRSKYDSSANKAYVAEVASLNAKLDLAQRNAPLERQAQIIANSKIKAIRDYNPDMDDDTKKKIQYQALEEARTITGAGKTRIRFTQEEWDAIQAGAISDHKLTQILNNADMQSVREMATPKEAKLMTPAKTQRAQAMLASGYTRQEVADALGVSKTTLDESME